VTYTCIPGLVEGDSIIIPPKSTTQVHGRTAVFSCEVQFGLEELFSWRFADNDIIYNYQDGVQYTFKDKEKFKIRKDGGTFTLTVKDLSYQDAGVYHCFTLTKKASANLTVLGMFMFEATYFETLSDTSGIFMIILG
jgi:hypothetical protein